jgi:hypothetical protein
MAKAAIAALTISIAREMGKYGVTSNFIAPRARTRSRFEDAQRPRQVLETKGTERTKRNVGLFAHDIMHGTGHEHLVWFRYLLQARRLVDRGAEQIALRLDYLAKANADAIAQLVSAIALGPAAERRYEG